jgi:hypothetical protein
MAEFKLPLFTRYANRSGEAGVELYAVEPKVLWVKFDRQPVPYPYSHRSAGRALVEQAKQLAEAGQGLTGFISTHMHELYDRELRDRLIEAVSG